MKGVVSILLGLALLALVYSDRHDLRSSWSNPAKWYSRDVGEIVDSRRPSQPLNAVAGVVLGLAAVIYGVIELLA